MSKVAADQQGQAEAPAWLRRGSLSWQDGPQGWERMQAEETKKLGKAGQQQELAGAVIGGASRPAFEEAA